MTEDDPGRATLAPGPTPREMNGLAVGAFVVSMVGLCGPLAILGLILGYIARKQIRTRNNSGSGLATAAIILGWISVIAFILLIAGVIVGIASGMGGQEYWDDWKYE